MASPRSVPVPPPARPQPPSPIVVAIDALAAGGDGVGRLADGRAVFVPQAAPGDRLRLEVTELRPSYARGRIVEVLQPGPGRVAAPCPVYAGCGGCQWQHLDYALQLQWKRRLVVEALERLGGLAGVRVHDCLPCDPPWAYRHKVAVPFALRGGRTVSGFYAPASHTVVEFPSCAVQHPALEEVVAAVRRRVAEHHVPGYDETRGAGVLRHLVARASHDSGEVLAVLVTAGDDRLPWAAGLMRDVPRLAGVLQNVNPLRTNAVFGPRTRLLAGRDHLVERLDGLRFLVSARSFFQVSPVQAGRLYRTALAYAAPGPGDVACDLYAGVGTLALYLARRASRVEAVEEVADAVADARRNAAANGLTNVRFHAGRVEERLADLGQRIDVAVLDPPRKGCDAAVLETLARLAPRRLVYVSCNPATLARDLGRLAGLGYAAAEAQPVDMFPQTAHVECVVRVERRSGAT